MSPARSTASHASVAYLTIHDFAQQPVADQARLNERLGEIVAKALPVLGADQGIVLDAPGGLAVVVLANPRGALQFAWRAAADREADFSVGLSHGAVRLAPGPLHVVYGDALITAEAVARTTEPGGVSVSREFRDAIARSHPGMRRPLVRIGSAIDAHERAHEMFRADESWVTARQRGFYALAAFTAAVVLAVGFAIRANRPPPPTPEPAPGAVTFDIKPQGEIYVDGTLKGTSPPLKRIQLPAGKHVIEVRNAALKPMVVELAIGPGEEFAVQHVFGAPPQPVAKSPARPRPKQQQKQEKSFWDSVADWFHGR
jgi:hypothetical protein